MLKLIAVLLAGASFVFPVRVEASTYADAVVDYTPGTDPNPSLSNPAAALGEPSRVTPGQWGGAVDPFSPPYLAEQIVSVGTGGSFTVEFASPIENDPQNPFGLDFIVFGNAGFIITNGDFSGGGITDGSLFSSGDGAGELWVSEDGQDFYRLSPALAPSLDGLFPTDGAGDFSKPVDPALTSIDFAGLDIHGIRNHYAGSGGGAGFDLDWAQDAEGAPVHLDSVRFLRVNVTEGHIELDGFADVAPVSTGGIPEKVFDFDFSSDPLAHGWQILGDASLVGWNAAAECVSVTWDSSRSNSYFALPLGLTLHRTDDFTVGFTFALEDIAIGVDPTKPYTFQIAAGLVNLASATDPELRRASGIHPDHGPRNLVEWTYFPDSGFGATVGPVVASRDNRMLFSSNYPLELQSGNEYRVEMTFSAETQILTTRMWKNGEPFGMGEETTLDTLKVTETFSDFALDAFAISSYSDAGQSPPEFAGSILAHAAFTHVKVVVRNRPTLVLQGGASPVLSFPTEAAWNYFVERSTDGRNWTEVGGPLEGGTEVQFTDENPVAGMALYRVRGERESAE